MTNQDELWAAQTQANHQARLILGIGPKETIVGDLPDDAFNYAIAQGVAKSLKELDEQYGLEVWYRDIDSLSGLLYFCRRCGANHYRIGSRIGQEHLQYEVHWAERALKDRRFYQKMYRESNLLKRGE